MMCGKCGRLMDRHEYSDKLFVFRDNTGACICYDCRHDELIKEIEDIETK